MAEDPLLRRSCASGMQHAAPHTLAGAISYPASRCFGQCSCCRCPPGSPHRKQCEASGHRARRDVPLALQLVEPAGIEGRRSDRRRRERGTSTCQWQGRAGDVHWCLRALSEKLCRSIPSVWSSFRRALPAYVFEMISASGAALGRGRRLSGAVPNRGPLAGAPPPLERDHVCVVNPSMMPAASRSVGCRRGCHD